MVTIKIFKSYRVGGTALCYEKKVCNVVILIVVALQPYTIAFLGFI